MPALCEDVYHRRGRNGHSTSHSPSLRVSRHLLCGLPITRRSVDVARGVFVAKPLLILLLPVASIRTDPQISDEWNALDMYNCLRQ